MASRNQKKNKQVNNIPKEPVIVNIDNIFSGNNIQTIADRTSIPKITENIAFSLAGNRISDIYPDIEFAQIETSTSRLYMEFMGGIR